MQKLQKYKAVFWRLFNVGRGFTMSTNNWIKACLVLAIIMSVGTLSGALNNHSITPIVKAASPAKQTHKLRSITHNKTRAVCAKPGRNQARCLLDETVNNQGNPLTGSPAISGSFGPAQFHTAYNLPCTPGGSVQSICSTPGSFGPQTIAIVDAGNFDSGSSGLVSSLQTYDQNYGLPACSTSNGCLSVVNQTGATSPLPSTVSTNWSEEIGLDVETAHMVCQTCKILLVEANDATTFNLAAADNEASTFSPVSISNSWGSTSDASSFDSSFNHPGIAVVAATGDLGVASSGAQWPSDIPNVVAVSGTTLQLNNDNTWANETVWSGSGGGCSTNYSAPSWQTSVSGWASKGCGSFRAFGDVSADADPNTGAAIFLDSTWYEFGGTSLSTPIIASIYALTGGLPSNAVAPSIPYATFGSSNFHDITSGNDCTFGGETHCTASSGFDTPSGIGSPNGILGFNSLPSQPTNLKATFVSQTHLTLSWTASTATNGITGYHIYKNGSLLATTSGTTYSDTAVSAITDYSYYVVAYDSLNDLSTPSATIVGSTYMPADITQDGHINLLDLSVLASSYGQTGTNLGRADINGDNKVDLLDLSILASQYGSE